MGPYAHFMQKEIFEQPGVVANTLEMVLNAQSISPRLFGSEAEDIFRSTRSILILACGTSYHAGLVARYWLETVAGLPCNVEIASEYRYRDPAADPEHAGRDDLAIGRDRRHAGRAEATPDRSGTATAWPSATWRKARWCGKRICVFSRAPARRSASPRPRRSPRSWRRCCCSP